MIAEVIVDDLSDDLAQGILEPDHSNTSPEWLDNNPHRAFAIEIVEWVLRHVNRLISYAKNHKGQFDLGQLALDRENLHSALLQFGARAKVNDLDWRRWNPPGRGWVFRCDCYPKERHIRQADWHEATSFVRSSEEPPLVRQLLAGAEAHAKRGNERVALTEAVSAIEACLHEFVRRPDAKTAFANTGVSGIKKKLNGNLGEFITDHLPDVFPPGQLDSITPQCRSAVRERNKVIHKGQRQVGKAKLEAYLRSLRDLTDALESWTP